LIKLPMKLSASFIARLVPIYMVSMGAGWFSQWLGLPLPWMIGPLLSTGILYLSGQAEIAIPVRTRPLGQLIVAAQVGLHFTYSAFVLLISMGPILIGMALITAVSCTAVAWAQARLSESRVLPHFLATFPTSPVEAAALAERYGVSPVPVILTQTLRISFVAILVPVAVFAVEGWPDRSALAAPVARYDVYSSLAILAAGIVGAGAFVKLRISTPFFLGPLTAVSILTVSGVHLQPLPPLALAGAQVILGTWLGSTFRPALFQSAFRMVRGAVATTVVILGFSAAGAVMLSALAGAEWKSFVLGAAPGGVGEMALTAQYLHVDVALVTAFHLVRIFILMPSVPLIVNIIDRYDAIKR
jgi:membrane AbrB-like protein